MSGFSTYIDNAILNKVYRNVDFTVPGLWAGLFRSEAGLEDNNVAVQQEQVGGGYTRANIPSSSLSVPANGAITSTVTAAFPEATTDWGTFSHMGLFDAAAGGNCVAWGVFRNPETQQPLARMIYAGDEVVIRPGSFNNRIINADMV